MVEVSTTELIADLAVRLRAIALKIEKVGGTVEAETLRVAANVLLRQQQFIDSIESTIDKLEEGR